MARRDMVLDQVGGILSREGLDFTLDDDEPTYRLFFDSTMIMVTVLGSEDDPIVKIHCPLLFDVDAHGSREAILARLNYINGEYRFLKTYLFGTTIVLHYAMPATELSAKNFMEAFHMVTSLSEMLDDTLKMELGGDRASDLVEQADVEGDAE